MAATLGSSLSAYAEDKSIDVPAPSRLTTLIEGQAIAHDADASLLTIALQVHHNLKHEHNWTDLKIHTHSPLTPDVKLARPLLSGLPPQRLYIHPDEQIDLLKEAKRRKQKVAVSEKAEEGTTSSNPDALDLKAHPEPEWVLPTRLNEKWSMRRLAEVFDGIGLVPRAENDQSLATPNKWRTTKRVLMAIADHDSTVVYYIVQDGIVKPRQN